MFLIIVHDGKLIIFEIWTVGQKTKNRHMRTSHSALEILTGISDFLLIKGLTEEITD